MNPWIMLFLFATLRLCTVFLVQTWFVPDEYWQSVEVAHRLVFGYGHLTWEWKRGIRSYLYPALLAVVLHILKLLNLDSVTAVVYAPRIFQAILTSIGDYCFWRWYCQHNRGRGLWASFALLTNWFWLYCGSRTLINTFETTLSTVALYLFPWHETKLQRSSLTFLWFVGSACIIRPTATVIWLPLCVYHLAMSHHRKSVILGSYTRIGVTVTACAVILDSYCYGRIVLTPLSFLQVNVMEGVGEFYGTHPYFWYITGGIPVVLGLHLLPFLLGAYRILKQSRGSIEKMLLFVILWTVVILSVIPHKEFRFLLPLMPMFMYVETSWLSRWSQRTHKLLLWAIIIITSIGNFALLGYFGSIHQRGTLDVMKVLSKELENSSILFLMPCHSTPLYSHLHARMQVRFLTCEPDFTGDPYYQDEADEFYRNPEEWLLHNMAGNLSFSHIIMYDSLYTSVKNFLVDKYSLSNSFFHTLHPSSRIGRYVQIYTRFKDSEQASVTQQLL